MYEKWRFYPVERSHRYWSNLIKSNYSYLVYESHKESLKGGNSEISIGKRKDKKNLKGTYVEIRTMVRIKKLIERTKERWKLIEGKKMMDKRKRNEEKENVIKKETKEEETN